MTPEPKSAVHAIASQAFPDTIAPLMMILACNLYKLELKELEEGIVRDILQVGFTYCYYLVVKGGDG